MVLLLGGTRGATKFTFTSALDQAAKAAEATRQSNRMSGIPLKNFRNGVSELSKLKSQEYPAVILILMVLLGMKSKYLRDDMTYAVQCGLTGLYLLWNILKRPWLDREEVKHLPGFTKR